MLPVKLIRIDLTGRKETKQPKTTKPARLVTATAQARSLCCSVAELGKSSLELMFYRQLGEALKDPTLDRLFRDMPCDDDWQSRLRPFREKANMPN